MDKETMGKPHFCTCDIMISGTMWYVCIDSLIVMVLKANHGAVISLELMYLYTKTYVINHTCNDLKFSAFTNRTSIHHCDESETTMEK